MKDEDKSKEQLLIELGQLRQQISGLEKSEAERKRMEVALRESEDRYRGLFNHMVEGCAYCQMIFENGRAQDWVYLAVNDAFENLTGLKNIIGKRVTEVIPGIQEADPELFNTYARVSLTGKPEKFEMFVKALKMWVSVSVYSPKKEFFVAIFDVITERKQMLEALRESEAHYRSLYEQAPLAYQSLDAQGCFIEVNQVWLDLMGYSRDQIIGRWFGDFLAPQEVDGFKQLFSRFKAIGEVHIDFEMVRCSGAKILVHIDGRIGHDERGQFKQTHCILYDVTERKRAEESLRESEVRYRELADSITDVFFAMDEDLKYTYWNKASERLTGISAKDAIDRSLYDLFPDTPEIRRAEKIYLETKRTRQPHSFVSEYRREDREFIFEVNVYPSQNGISVFTKDITDRKRVEEALRSEKDFSERLINSCLDGIFTFDHTLCYTTWNPGMERFSGVTKAEALGKCAFDLFPFLKETGEDKYFIDALSGKTTIITDRAFVAPAAGRQGFFEGQYSPIILESGDIIGGLAIIRDISERKQREEEIKNLAKFPSENPNPVLRLNQHGIILYANEASNPLLQDWESEVGGYAPTFWCDMVRDIFKSQSHRTIEVECAGKVYSFLFAHITGVDYVNLYGRDITEQKKIEAILKKEREELKLIIDSSPIIIFYKDKEGKFLRVNKTFAEALKMPEEEFLEKTVFDLYSANIAQGMTEDDQKVLKTGLPKLNIIEQYESASGIRWVQTDKVPIFDKYGIPVSLIGFAQDITERKRAEEALRDSEEKFRTLFENSKDAIYITTQEGQFVDFNNSTLDLFGYTKDEMMRLNAKNLFFHPPDRLKFQREIEKKGSVRDYAVRFRKKVGTKIYCLLTSTLRLSKDGKILGYHGIMRDITESKQREEDLRNSREQLRALAGRLQVVREEERTQIAREIHDELGQQLTGLKMDLSWLSKKFPKPYKSLKNKTESMLKLVDETIQSVRIISSELRPGILDDLGLVAAIEWQAQDFQTRTGIKCDFCSTLEEVNLGKDLSTAAFRIFQETLTNVARHANASRVKISLRGDAGALVLEVQDDGRGINKNKISNSKSLGILGMRERALLFGGKLNISGRRGKGTIVTLSIPMGKL